jgi:hypothetical protein
MRERHNTQHTVFFVLLLCMCVCVCVCMFVVGEPKAESSFLFYFFVTKFRNFGHNKVT